MTPQQIRDEIDARTVQHLAYIAQVQAGYFQAHSRYAQGLRSHLVIPADGLELPPDNLQAAPADQVESWADLCQLPALMLSALEIDAYEGPGGHGYVVRNLVRLDGALWRRQYSVGPEPAREQGWFVVEEG